VTTISTSLYEAHDTWSKQQPPTKTKNFHRMNRNWRHTSENHVCHYWQTFMHFADCSQYACLTPAVHKYLSVASELFFNAAGQLIGAATSMEITRRSYFFWRTTFVCLALIIRPDDCTLCLNDVMQWCVNYFWKLIWLWVWVILIEYNNNKYAITTLLLSFGFGYGFGWN